MLKTLVAVAAVCLAGGAQAQVLSYAAQGLLQPLPTTVDGGFMLLEVLGNGPSGPNTEYYSIEPPPGSVAAEAGDYTAALAGQVLAPYTQATAHFAYDLAASPIRIVSPGFAYYPAVALTLQLATSGGGGGQVQAAAPEVASIQRRSTNAFSVQARGEGYPPDMLPMGQTLAFDDPTPPEYRLDLRALMASSGCCSSLHTTAPGDLPVVLRAPASYRPVYMGLSLDRSRDSALPPVESLPAALDLDLATYDRGAGMYVAFGGHYGLSLDEADYASNADYLAARSWIDTNIGLVNIEIAAIYNITRLQAVPVPEPATTALFAAGALLLLGWRRRPFHKA